MTQSIASQFRNLLVACNKTDSHPTITVSEGATLLLPLEIITGN